MTSSNLVQLDYKSKVKERDKYSMLMKKYVALRTAGSTFGTTRENLLRPELRFFGLFITQHYHNENLANTLKKVTDQVSDI